MIDYSEYTLANGLRVVANRDRLSELAAVNMLGHFTIMMSSF